MDVRKDILWRVYLSFLGIILLGVVVLGKTIYIQRVEGKFWKGMGDSLHLKYMPIHAQRGSIYSEDGNMLSTSVPVFDVFVDFAAEGLREKNGLLFKTHLDSLSICMHQLFQDRTVAEYKSELEQAYREKERYYLLKRKISFDAWKKMNEFPLIKLGKNKSGFIFETRDKRINPYVLLANRTIGLSRKDSTKNVGLERSYDSVLKGTTGQRLMRYAAGIYLPVEGAEVDPVNGKDVITTLDTYTQDVAEQELMNMLVDNNSTHGTVIVMEVATGKIKAIANLGVQPDKTFNEDLNYGIGKATEPGSVFKLVTLLSLLEDKYIDIDTKVDCEGGVRYFYGLRIKDSHLGAGVISVQDAFMMSSNVAFAKLADQHYNSQPEKWYSHLEKFRLTKETGIDIVATSGKPIIKSPRNKAWGKTSIPFMAHGYEELVTPLHMLMLYNAVANNGRMMKPYLVNAIREHGVNVQVFSPQVLEEKICSEATVQKAKICLSAVVDSAHGTAYKHVHSDVYPIAGKTGTAVTAQTNKGYVDGKKIYQSSFIGFFPADKPVYSMAVVIQNSKESKQTYGGPVAGTVFKKISDRIYNRFLSKPGNAKPTNADTISNLYSGWKPDFQYLFEKLKVEYTDSSDKTKWTNASFSPKKKTVMTTVDKNSRSNIMPDVKGMGLKDALYLLENKGLTVMVSGKGKVLSQSLTAGTTIKSGQQIILMLN
jgi:cell division protein FtsI (penicillin-binding protein 3)